MRKDIDETNLGFLLGKIKGLFAKASNSTPITTSSVISLNETMNLDVPLYVHFLQQPTPLVIGNATSLCNPIFLKQKGFITIIFSVNQWTAPDGFSFSLCVGNHIGSHIANTLTTPPVTDWNYDYKIVISWKDTFMGNSSGGSSPTSISATYQKRYGCGAWVSWS